MGGNLRIRLDVRRRVKELAKSLLSMFGYEIHQSGFAPSWSYSFNQLRTRGFHPKTVIDIGVAEGTPDLYCAFPHAQYILVDPTRESLPHMKAIATRLNAKILNIALGETEDDIEMTVRTDDIGGSSFFEEIGPLGPTTRYRVPVRRFDQVIPGFERPALCKIDVQGGEIMLLRGMGSRIEEIDAFVIECSVIATVKGGPEVAEIFAFFFERGFVLYNVLSMSRRPLDHALAQVDLLFVKAGSTFRADRRWAAIPTL